MHTPFCRLVLPLALVLAGSLAAQTLTVPRVVSIGGGGGVDPGQRVVLTPVFSGNPIIDRFQWRKDGADLAGATTRTLVFDPVAVTDAGSYVVVASNAAGVSTPTVSATLTVRPAAAPVFTTPPNLRTADVGQSIAFSFAATGAFPRTYQWRRNGAVLAGATETTFRLTAITLADAGAYTVQVSNSLGSAISEPGILTVNVARLATFRDSAPASQTLGEGSPASLVMLVDGGSTPFLYQWLKGGVPVRGATFPELSLEGVIFSDAGRYALTVSNAAGSVTSPELEVIVQPARTPDSARLENDTLLVGGVLSLDASRSGGPETYQWYKNGIPIPQATGTSHNVRPVTIDTAGSYFVIATKAVGSTTSRTAEVTVLAERSERDWLATERNGDIAYFAFANPARIERFDLAREVWLAPLLFARPLTAFTINGGFIYVGFGQSISRFSIDGLAETPIASGRVVDATGLQVLSGFLLVTDRAGELTTIRLSDNAKVGTLEYPLRIFGPLALVANRRFVLGRSGQFSGSLVTLALQPGGTAARTPDVAPDPATFAAAAIGSRIFVAPDESFFADDEGGVYRTANWSFAGSLGSVFEDLDFAAGAAPVVLRGATVHVHDSRFRETGRLAAAVVGKRVFVRGTDVFVFGSRFEGGTIPRQKLSLLQARPASAAVALNPAGLGFVPDSIQLDRDGGLLLHSKLHRQLFRWSTAERRFLPSLPLQGWPNAMAYSTALHRAYLGYADGRVTQIRLAEGQGAEDPFSGTIPQVHELVAMDQHLLVGRAGFRGYPVGYGVFAPDGGFSVAGGGGDGDNSWSPSNRRLYFLNSQDLIYSQQRADGSLARPVNSPHNGRYPASSPVRVSPDGRQVLVGTGRFFDGETLQFKGELPILVGDAAWIGNRVFTGRATASGIEVQRWNGVSYASERTAFLPGRLMRLLTLGNRLLAVTVRDGLPYFCVLDDELNVLSADFGGLPNRLANLSTRARVGEGVEPLIPGFVISGAHPKTVLVRVAGPVLADFGLTDAVAFPAFTVRNGTGTVVASNFSSATAPSAPFVRAVSARVGAFAFPSGSADTAALLNLDPGAYTVQVGGANGAAGIALVEIYDAQDNLGSSRIVNIATRGQVGSGAGILISGITVQGDTPRTLLIRAVGPALAAFGVGGVLANPRLRLFRGNDLIGENDDWGEGAAAAASLISNAASSVGAFSLGVGSRDSALLLTLPPGSYTAQVSGVADTTGVALVEVYEVP